MEFDRNKFKALLYCVVCRTGDRVRCGATKLYKVLWSGARASITDFFALDQITRREIALFLMFVCLAWLFVGVIFLWLPQCVAAWLITLLCVFISGIVALLFLAKNFLFFTATALLAFSMTLLLPYWKECTLRPETTVIGVYTSFLSVCIGTLLMKAKAQHLVGKKAWHLAHNIGLWQATALAMLLFVVWPSTPGIPEVITIHGAQVALLMDDLLGAVGFAAVVLGVRRCCSRKASLAIAVIAVCYQLIDILYGFEYVPKLNSDSPAVEIAHSYAYFFSVAKLNYTIFFSSFIAFYGMPKKYQKQKHPFRWMIQKLVGYLIGVEA